MNTNFYIESIVNNRIFKTDDLTPIENTFLKFSNNANYENWLIFLSSLKSLRQVKIFSSIDSRYNVSSTLSELPSHQDIMNYISVFDSKNKTKQYLWPKSELILDNMPENAIINLLNVIKKGYFGNVEEFNQKYFIQENLPIIDIMDYALKRKKYNLFLKASEKLEIQYLVLYFDMHKEYLLNYLEENKDDKEVYFILCHLPSDKFKEYINKDFETKINELPFGVVYNLIANEQLSILLSTNELTSTINSNDFIEYFKKLKYEEQVILVNLLLGMDYPKSFILSLKELWNDKKTKIKVIDRFPYDDIMKLYNEIIHSSFYYKTKLYEHPYFHDLKNIDEKRDIKKLLLSKKDYYGFLLEQHTICKNYATNSIVNSLFDVRNLDNEINYMDLDKFNILVRVLTFWDHGTLEESFNQRTFAGFSVINENNFSHYPGNLLMAFYEGVTPDMIYHICPIDSLSESYAKYSKDLSEFYSSLYDIDDLNRETYNRATYNQLCIRTKDNNGNILKTNCAICTDENDLDSVYDLASQANLKTLVLRRNPKTIENSLDIYETTY